MEYKDTTKDQKTFKKAEETTGDSLIYLKNPKRLKVIKEEIKWRKKMH
jgi:hypothetical protein